MKAKPYYANPGPAQMRRDGCAMMLAVIAAALALVGVYVVAAVLSQPIF